MDGRHGVFGLGCGCNGRTTMREEVVRVARIWGTKCLEDV